eukprot:TRINITY_DN3455_c0_g1_i1.p1 TRINITY_DN3455_c0_g1~~TRINITY_DN3455_c0_g1_i1.p1  ORF type:complete len:128 (-),score=9.91 TRINITY_DN3455_c0_g1_i1:151-534(-)
MWSVASHDTLDTVLYIISAIFLIILGIFTVFAALRKKAMWLLLIAIILFCILIIALVQLIINAIVYKDCNGGASGFFSQICHASLASFYAPTIIFLVITLGGGILCLLLRKEIIAAEGGEPKGSYYA